MDDYDPALRPSRAAWKDWHGAYLDRGQAAREQREQDLNDYQQAALSSCPHGRVRVTGLNGRQLWAGLQCREGKCPIAYMTMAQVYQDWQAGLTSEMWLSAS